MRIHEYKDALSIRDFAHSRILIQANQGKNAGIYALLAFAVCGLLHVAIGADPLVSALAVTFSGCSPQTETAAPQPRPVRTVTIEQREAGAAVPAVHPSRFLGITSF